MNQNIIKEPVYIIKNGVGNIDCIYENELNVFVNKYNSLLIGNTRGYPRTYVMDIILDYGRKALKFKNYAEAMLYNSLEYGIDDLIDDNFVSRLEKNMINLDDMDNFKSKCDELFGPDTSNIIIEGGVIPYSFFREGILGYLIDPKSKEYKEYDMGQYDINIRDDLGVILVTRSPYFSYTGPRDPDVFCNIVQYNVSVKIPVFCVPDSWFEEGVAPYNVYKVDDKSIVSVTDPSWDLSHSFWGPIPSLTKHFTEVFEKNTPTVSKKKSKGKSGANKDEGNSTD